MISATARAIVALGLAPALAPALAGAQADERYSLAGRDVAIYNLVGTLDVRRGTGDRVQVDVRRGGADAARLSVATGVVRGRQALRIDYPSDRIVYPQRSHGSRSSLSIAGDGTFGDSGMGRDGGRRRVEVRGSGPGLEAYADLVVTVPAGTRLFLRNGVGESTVRGVEGDLDVSVAAARVQVAAVKGSLTLSTGSGGVEVSDLTGSLRLESGSGGATLDGIRGSTLEVEVGSGSLRGRAIEVGTLTAEVGSGGVRLASVRAPRVRLETGSGGSDIELLGTIADVSVEAGSGGVTLRLPPATGAAVDIETGSGGIVTDFDVRVQRMERRALRGTMGDGSGRIRVEAGSGTVRLLRN